MKFLSRGLILPLAVVLVALASIFGGGARNGLPSDLLPEAFAILVLGFVAVPGFERMRSSVLHLACLTAVVALPLLYAVPLPASLALQLPGREEAREIFGVLGIGPQWLALSLRPTETWRSFFSLLPALSLALAVAALDLRGRIVLLMAVLAFAALNVFIALGQIIGGANSGLYFYEITNRGRAVGLFANANHYTAFLYAAIPFAAALFSGSSERSSPKRDAMLLGTLFLLVVGLAISGSRTAVILGGVSLVLSLALVARKTMLHFLSKGLTRAVGAFLIVAAIPILLGIGLFQIFVRLEDEDPFSDLRYRVLDNLFTLVRDYFPFGAGFGTFERIYELREALSNVSTFPVQHAHNDILELLIEGGMLAAIAMACVVIGLLIKTYDVLQARGLIEERIEKASVISLWLLIAHSVWDYPLRTIAVSSLFAMALGFLIKPYLINVETIADVMRHLREMKSLEFVERLMGKKRHRRRRSSRAPDLPVGSEDRVLFG